VNPAPLLNGIPALQELYVRESGGIRQRFEESHDGQAAIRERSALLDTIVGQIWGGTSEEAAGRERLCVAALGGYGRRALFPCSDVDLLFLCEAAPNEDRQRRIRGLCQTLWDLHLRVSPTTRTVDDCSKLYRDNLEFSISLLDCRYICGDVELFQELRTKAIPKMVAREASELLQRLTDLTRARHNKYGHTIFHLEPNIKDSPGGMRDYQVACWLTLALELEKTGVWPRYENVLPAAFRKECGAALDFLSAVRCFLHYRQGRDLNGLSYELQSEAAAAGIGLGGRMASTPSDWMRAYFRHVRSIYRLTVLLDEVPPLRSGLYRLFESRKSRLSNADFSVVEGCIFLRQLASVEDPPVLFGLFEFVARHGLKFSAETERCVEAALPKIQSWVRETPDLWAHFRRILVLPHAGAALRAMHRLGLLVLLFPEFRLIDSLVVRDYYHRYTVDEHSVVTIESLHELGKPGDELEKGFREILEGIERPELLFLALLCHDIGKGMPAESHVEGSLEAVEAIFDRLRLEPGDREIVTFLIANHLLMSATVMRRDIFDPQVVRDFAESMGTVERLKMLTLLTFADIKSVNPQALTPWKADMLWRFHAATENYLNRSVDEKRLHLNGGGNELLERILHSYPDASELKNFRSFLEGFPERYLHTHSTEEIIAHYGTSGRLDGHNARVSVAKREAYFELTLVTSDRPRLFTKVAGTLSSWGMDILKAEGFANKAGIVVDTIRFSDRYRTLELNPSETERLAQDVAAAVSGKLDVKKLMEAKARSGSTRLKLTVRTQVHFDSLSSSHSTLLEIVAQDRPALLYDISSTLAKLGCNIEVVLIDTQGQAAIDVFYLSHQGGKLSSQTQRDLEAALLRYL
jgi:[protein-PII] uridylyltransferase